VKHLTGEQRVLLLYLSMFRLWTETSYWIENVETARAAVFGWAHLWNNEQRA